MISEKDFICQKILCPDLHIDIRFIWKYVFIPKITSNDITVLHMLKYNIIDQTYLR